MSAAQTTQEAGEIALDRLDAVLRQALPGLSGKPHLARIGGGQSNPTFYVTYDNRRLVLRKQPTGDILPSAHAVDREARVIAALAGTDVPVPPVLLFHAERDVVGTPFYVMERVEGRVFHDSALPGVSPQERRAMYFAMAETLARLHAVDPAAIGLGDFGKPGNYFKRQIERWTRQWQAAKFREIPEMDALAAWLPPRIPPEDGQAVVCHGDYRLGNLMFHPTEPRVVAVLDWELATLGHPLADAAYSCCLAWHSRPEWYGGVLGLDTQELGIPSEAGYLDRYYAATGNVGRVETFHLAFSLFRFAAILEGIASRVRAGTAAAANAAAVGDLSVAYARHACGIIEQRG